jgi:hypothetical protein
LDGDLAPVGLNCSEGSERCKVTDVHDSWNSLYFVSFAVALFLNVDPNVDVSRGERFVCAARSIPDSDIKYILVVDRERFVERNV